MATAYYHGWSQELLIDSDAADVAVTKQNSLGIFCDVGGTMRFTYGDNVTVTRTLKSGFNHYPSVTSVKRYVTGTTAGDAKCWAADGSALTANRVIIVWA